MPRGILLIAGLAMFSAIFGQGQTANPSTTTPPVNGPFGGPILVTPSAGFPNPVPTAGISDAGRAGISNATNGIENTNTPSSPADDCDYAERLFARNGKSVPGMSLELLSRR